MYQSWKRYRSGITQSASGFIIPTSVLSGSDFVTDTFTEAVDTTLASHTPELGGPWNVHPSYTGTILVDSTLDQAYLNSASAGGYYASGAPPSANYYVEADFSRLSLLSNNVGILLGFDTTVDTGILLRLNDNGATQTWDLIDRITGANTTLASVSANIPSVGGAAVKARLIRSGTSLTVFFDGVQNVSLNSTTSLTAIGKVGIRASGTASSSTGIHLGNYSAR